MNKQTLQTVILLACGLVVTPVAVAFAWQQVTEKNDAKIEIQSEVSAETVSDSQAAELLKQARHRLFEWRTVQADIVQKISMGGVQVESSGSYASAAEFRYRLQYRILMGELQADFLEVCDGQLLHTRRQIVPITEQAEKIAQPEMELSRRDIQRIRREALQIKDGNIGQNIEEALRAAEIGIGGLPAILAVLERSLVLLPVRTQTVEGREYFVLQGSMKPEERNGILGQIGPAAAQIEGYLPDLVRIYCEKDSLFPEKFVYLKKSDNKGNFQPLISVEFKNVLLNQPVQDAQFVYMAPPGVEERDETQLFLDSMNAAAEQPVSENPAVSPAEPALPARLP